MSCVRVCQDGDLDKIMAYFDTDDDGHISLNEFVRGIRVGRCCCCCCTSLSSCWGCWGNRNRQFQRLKLYFSPQAYVSMHSRGHIEPAHVLCSSCLQGTMSKNRKMLVREAYKRLDKTGDGVVTIEDLMIAYNANAHPEVVNGRMTPEVTRRGEGYLRIIIYGP